MELERDIENYLIKKVEELGGLCLKFGVNGWPDRICMLQNGVVFFVEVKRFDGTPSALQVIRRKSITDLGTGCYFVFSRQDVDRILEKEKTP